MLLSSGLNFVVKDVSQFHVMTHYKFFLKIRQQFKIRNIFVNII